MEWCKETYIWLKQNDIPNWILFIVVSVIWPIVLYFWNKRKFNHIHDLQISLSRDTINLNGNMHDALRMTLTNRTDSTLFLTNFRIKNRKSNLKIHPESTRDFSTSYYPFLFFNNNNNRFDIKDIILYTGNTVFTSIALENRLNDEFLNYRPNWIRKFLGIHKFYIVQYTVFMNEKRYFIKTKY